MVDRPLVGITVNVGGAFLKIRHFYTDAVIKVGGIPVLIPPTGDPAFFAQRIDRLLIPGGDDLDPSYYHGNMMPQVKAAPREKSDFEISLFNEVVKRKKPVLGICYGMQIINVALGGTLYEDIGSQVSSGIDHRKGYHRIVIGRNGFLKEGQFHVNSTHHQAIKELGDGLVGFALAPDKLIEAFYMKGYPFLLGVQWHPERLMHYSLSLDIFKSFVGTHR